MPFVKDSAVQLGPVGHLPQPVEATDTESPAFWDETVPAAWRLGNNIGSANAQEDGLPNQHNKINATFDPFEGLLGTKYEQNLKSFMRVNTPDEVEAMKRQLDREETDWETIQQSGGMGFVALMGAGMIDPVNLIPVGGTAAKAYQGGKLVISGIKVGVRAGLVSSAVAEAGLHTTQETLTVQDSAIAVGMGTFLGGVLGGAGAVVRHLIDTHRLGKLHDGVKTADANGNIGGSGKSVNIPMAELKTGLKAVKFDEGGGVLKADGTAKLDTKYGMVKVVWKHGVQSGEPVAFKLTKEDVTSFPGVMRKYEATVEGSADTGGQSWVWSVNRKGPDGKLRKVMYVASKFLNGDGEDHLVTVYVAGKDGKGKPLSKKRRSAVSDSLSGVFGFQKDTAGEATVSPHPGSEGATPTPIIAKDGDGVTKAMDAVRQAKLEARVVDDLTVPPDHMPDPLEPGSIEVPDVGGEGGDAGAKLVRDTTLEEETLKSALGLEKAFKFQDPTIRGATSPSIETRRTMQTLAEQPLRVEKNANGIANPIAVETRIKAWQRPLALGVSATDDAFIQYRTGHARKFGDVAKAGFADVVGDSKRKGLMTREEFNEAVGKAARRGDKHPIPEVMQAAQVWRDTLFDPGKDRAIQEGLFPSDIEVKTATSYLTRVYIHEKIAAQRPKFVQITNDWLRAGRDKAAMELEALDQTIDGVVTKEEGLNKGYDTAISDAKALDDELPAFRKERDEIVGDPKAKAALNDYIKSRVIEVKALRKAARKARKERVGVSKKLKKLEKARKELAPFATLEDFEVRDIAEQITDKVQGNPAGRIPYETVPLVRGPLKERTFNIPDVLIEDYLDNNIERVARAYTRTMAPDIELTAAFGRADMEVQIERIGRDYNALIAKAETEGERTRLAKLKKRDMDDVSAVRDRLTGRYALPETPDGVASRSIRTVKSLNYVRYLGGMTLSAIPDMGRGVMVHGLGRVAKDGIVPLARNLKNFRMAAEEVKMAGTALDMVLDTRTMAIADIMDDYGRYSRFERGLKGITDKFGYVSLMAPWNAAMKQFVGIIGMTRTLKAAKAVVDGTITDKELERLAWGGIDEDMARRISAQFDEHGEVVDGVWLAKTDKWTTGDTVTAFRGHLVKEVDMTIVTPGQDKPLWMSTQVGSVFGQFKSFQIASVQRTLLSGLQQRDAAALNGALMMTGLGMMTYAFKSWDAGREVSDDWRVWLVEGVDRSGLTGWLYEVNNITEKVTQGQFGLNAMLGGAPNSRYFSRSIIDSVAGPTGGAVNDLAYTAGALAKGDWRKSNTRALRRLLPYQNLMGFRKLVDRAEAGINNALGVRK